MFEVVNFEKIVKCWVGGSEAKLIVPFIFPANGQVSIVEKKQAPLFEPKPPRRLCTVATRAKIILARRARV